MPRARYYQLKRMQAALVNQSEDCLYLNLYAPNEGIIIIIIEESIWHIAQWGRRILHSLRIELYNKKEDLFLYVYIEMQNLCMLLYGWYISSLAIESIVITQILLLATFPLGISIRFFLQKYVEKSLF